MGAARGLGRLPAAIRFHVAQMQELGNSPDALKPENTPQLVNPNLETRTTVAVGLSALLLIFVLRLYLEKKILPRVFPGYKHRTQSKIAENLFYTVFYTLSAAAGFIILYVERLPIAFLFKNDRMWTFWQDLDKGVPMSLPFRLYYTSQLGLYIGFFAFLVMMDSRRSDFREYLLHHATSIILLAGSLVFGYARFGAYILTLHDISDIFLHGAKTVHYLGYKGLDTLFFVGFVISFYILRLYIFPRIVIGIIMDPWLILAEQPTFNKWLYHWHIYLPQWFVCVGALVTLLLLHCYWFCLALQIVKRELQGTSLGETGDPRSDSESDDD